MTCKIARTYLWTSEVLFLAWAPEVLFARDYLSIEFCGTRFCFFINNFYLQKKINAVVKNDMLCISPDY